MEQYDDLFYLGKQVAGYIEGKLTSEELRSLELWLAEDPQHGERFRTLTDAAKLQADFSVYGSKNKAAAWARIAAESGYVKKAGRSVYWVRYAAAIVVIGISIGGYFFLHEKAPQQQIVQNQTPDILPGSNKAMLTLSNGQHIDLADAKNGTIANEGHTAITKASDGTLTYNGSSEHRTDKSIYNTVTTPRGGQWPLVLPDGTKVILDAASSITYPVNFVSNERKVTITGQAYFEVVHNGSKPFRVSVGGQTIEDIGTHFNIKAYKDEPQIKTTLIEGSVNVFNSIHHLILKPGEQAVTEQDQHTIKLRKDADLKQILAWKNGTFRFHQTGLHELMRDLSRWYNIDVIYKGEVKDEPYYGTISRKLTLNQTLAILQLSDIHFKIGPGTATSAGTLIITP